VQLTGVNRARTTRAPADRRDPEQIDWLPTDLKTAGLMHEPSHPELTAPAPLGQPGAARHPARGLGEVGRNMTVFEYDGKLLIVDCGYSSRTRTSRASI